MNKVTKKRPVVAWPSDPSLEQIGEFIQTRRDQPIERAASKLFDFVNSCVTDADFRHPQSEHLLSFLMVTRDVLTDGINEHWTMDDILQPIAAAISARTGRQAKGKPKPNRKTPLRRGLELLVAEGLGNEQILDALGDADGISNRAMNGFPFEVCEPATTLKEDGSLRYYRTGENSDRPIEAKVKDIRKTLSRIRSHKAA